MTTDRNSEGAVANAENGDFDCPHAAAARECPCGFCLALRTGDGLSESIRLLMCVLEDNHRHGHTTPEILNEIQAHVYTTPPASIPAAEVQALVERMEKASTNTIIDAIRRDAAKYWARELAKLIPRSPE